MANGRKECGRPPTMSYNELISMAEFVSKSFLMGQPVMYFQLVNHIEKSFKKTVNPSTLRGYISRMKLLKTIEGKPDQNVTRMTSILISIIWNPSSKECQQLWLLILMNQVSKTGPMH